MIEGLKVTIGADELKQLCEDRAKFHDGRVAFYGQQKAALPAIDEDVPSFSNASKQPGEMMSERIRNHKAQAAELRFIGTHIKAGEEFLLDRNDLQLLGIIETRY